MSVPTLAFPKKALLRLGLTNVENIHYQSPPEELIQDSIRIGEGVLNDTGALVIRTGEFDRPVTQRQVHGKDDITEKTVNWNDFNIAMDPKYFDVVNKEILNYLDKLPDLWVRDCYACADPRYRLNIRVVNEKPWNNLFAYNMFLRPTEEELDNFEPAWHVLSAPGLKLDSKKCGTRQHNAAIVSFKHKTILIAGSGYTGETSLARTAREDRPQTIAADAGPSVVKGLLRRQPELEV